LVEIVKKDYYICPPLICYVDEVQGLSDNIIQILLKATEYNDAKLMTESNKIVNCYNVCWIIATTETGNLCGAFLNRFTVLNLTYFTEQEKATIVGQAKLARLVRNTLDRTQGNLSQEDMTDGWEICKKYGVCAEAAKQIRDVVRGIWHKTHPVRFALVRANTTPGKEDAVEYDRVIADCSKAIGLDPNWGPSYAVRGDAYRLRGDYGRAIADSSEAIGLDPKWGPSYVVRGDSYRLKGDYERGIADCREAIRLDPNCAWAYAVMGESYQQKGDYKPAIACCTEAIRLDPNCAWAYAVMGESYRLKGD